MSLNVYEIITEAILSRLAQGDIPWRKPWKFNGEAGAPRNFISGKPYRGCNVFLLSGWETPFFLSYKQATECGAQVRKGEKSSLAIFWNICKRKDSQTGEEKKIFLLRYYRVFNVAQCDNVPAKRLEALKKSSGIIPAPDAPKFSPIESAETIISAYTGREPDLKTNFGGGRACYSPTVDTVTLPTKESFGKPEEFYCTAFHEYAHSTGAANRLNREGITKNIHFGSERYSKEELIAEFSAAFLCGVSGIELPILDNSAAYILHWSQKLASEPKLFVQASGAAQKVADYILHGKGEAPAIVDGGEVEPEGSEELEHAQA